jgi:hypothetical protein
MNFTDDGRGHFWKLRGEIEAVTVKIKHDAIHLFRQLTVDFSMG